MIRVGFVLTGHDWMGGLNYFRNLFSALSLLDEKRIQAILFVGSQVPDDVVRHFQHIEVVRSTLLDMKTPAGVVRRGLNKISGRRDPLLRLLLRRHSIDVLSHFSAQWGSGKIKKISWIPDFQHVHLPSFFSTSELAQRDAAFHGLARASDCILLSSSAAQRDLAKFSPAAISKSAVLPFVPEVDPNMRLSSIQNLESKYGFSGSYFYIPNQFWIHKNHDIVVDALVALNAKGITATVLLSGNTSDYRHPDHFSRLMTKVQACGVEASFKVLGIIPYDDLISLMHYSAAIINPSLFEGWSSTVEEAKTLGKTILLSNLPVHIEQNPKKGVFFDPNNAVELAEKMQSVLADIQTVQPCKEKRLILDESYNINRLAFAQKYQEIVKQVMKS